jgi:broad specificity phosphatase PhoE
MDTHNILVVTHNSRLRNFLKILDPVKFKKEIRFKNCAILKLTINSTNNGNFNYALDLIYEGSLSDDAISKAMKKPNKYISFKCNRNPNEINDPCINIYNIITHDEFTNTHGTLPFIFSKSFNEGIEYNIYLVRHGEGVHNTYDGFWNKEIKNKQIILDALLTELPNNQLYCNSGKKQTERAAFFLFSYLNNSKNSSLNYVFASRLRRAFTTAAIFMETLNIQLNHSQKQKLEVINILPCSHELTGSSDNSLLPPEAAENKSICMSPNIREEPKCNPNCLMNKKIHVIQVTYKNIK